MSPCSKNAVTKNLDRYYHLLGLEPGASIEEVNQAYKDLVFIWHPDRIPGDNHRLQEKAQEKLKSINEARDRLRAAHREGRIPRPQAARRSHSPAPPKPQRPSSHTSSQASSRPSSRPPRRPSRDLSHADLRGANFREKDLSGRNMEGAILVDANLSDAFMHRVNLTGADLSGANLFRANLLEADLKYAILRDANLIGADLSGADLSHADLRGAKVGSGNRLLVKLTGSKLTDAILPDGSVYQ
ncbi:molecular chaperone DnaJ [Phormidium willei BDU 130791]|nr:molecular chaperone DnaJ [Phormidium willei BDU 130791]